MTASFALQPLELDDPEDKGQDAETLPLTLPTVNKQERVFTHRRWRVYFTREHLLALSSVAALTGSLMVYGILQERIMTVPFGPENRRFRHSLFLVLCNRLVACFIALLTVCITAERVEPLAPVHSYGFISLANVVSSACQYEALKYVSFPVQVLAKCTKMIPVMIWQTAIAGTRYSAREYLEAIAVAVGCAVFLLTGEVIPHHTTAHRGAFYLMGGSIMLLYLAVDGFTSTWQDWLFTGYDMGIGNQVLYTTMCSIVLSVTGLVLTGKLIPALEFMQEYPEAWIWVLGISLASAAVQFLVTHTIKQYGALVFATVMTTRQWFSILLSCLLFSHPLSLGQWVGTVVVFGALYQRFYEKRRRKSSSAL